VYFILMGTGILLAAGILVTLVVRLALLLLRRRPTHYWRRALWLNLLLVPGYALLIVPGAMGWFGSRLVGTRRDERGYEGPRFAADGRWLLQSRASLAADRAEREAGGAAAASQPAPQAVRLESRDGVPLRAFFVAARAPARGVAVVLVHGLFRGALELEPVGAMLRDLGADVLLLELRNHGGSGRATPTFGRDEASDVEAAAAHLRARAATRDHRIVLFGVSLGTVAVSLAAPEAGVAGLVLDAPVADLLATAHRMLAASTRGAPRRLGLPEPFRSLVIRSVGLWCGVDLAAIQPLRALEKLSPAVRALVIGAELDDRVTPAEVRAVHDALASPPPLKDLWICPGADHGGVWTAAPDEYRARLRAFLDRLE
jgi:dienelactone hydrolase